MNQLLRVELLVLLLLVLNFHGIDVHGFVSPAPSSSNSRNHHQEPNNKNDHRDDWKGQLTLDGLKTLLLQKTQQGKATKESLLNSRLEELVVPNNNNNDNDESSEGSLLFLNRTRIGEKSMVDHADEYNVGRGLFATMDCKKGDLLSCYPGDLILKQKQQQQQQQSSSGNEETIKWGSHVPESFRRHIASSASDITTPANDDDGAQAEEANSCNGMIRSSTIPTQLSGYILQVSDEIAVIGLPAFDEDNMAYAGHYANDGAVPPQKDSHLAPYVLESNAKANAMHISIVDNCHMATIATKDISKGEEILVTYGPDYWIDHPLWKHKTSSSLNHHHYDDDDDDDDGDQWYSDYFSLPDDDDDFDDDMIIRGSKSGSGKGFG